MKGVVGACLYGLILNIVSIKIIMPTKKKPKTDRKPRPKDEPSPLLGAHMSISGGPSKALERGRSIGCTAIQIFVKNNMQWFAKPYLPLGE